MMPRQYMRFGGGAAKVAELIGLVPSNHGTTNPLAPLLPGCVACRQQVADSDFITKLNAGDETPGRRASFTQITTRDDAIVTPSLPFLEGPERRVLIQDRPGDLVGNLGVIYGRVALQWVKNALPAGQAADPAFERLLSDSGGSSRPGVP